MKGNEMPPLMRPAAGVRPILIAGKEVIMEILELKKKANEVRRGILTAVHAAKSGHPGGSLSAADIFTYPIRISFLYSNDITPNSFKS